MHASYHIYSGQKAGGHHLKKHTIYSSNYRLLNLKLNVAFPKANISQDFMRFDHEGLPLLLFHKETK